MRLFLIPKYANISSEGVFMAIMPTEQEARQEARRREAEERIRQDNEEQFVGEWKSLSEEERAKLVFRELSKKADKNHSHPHEKF